MLFDERRERLGFLCLLLRYFRPGTAHECFHTGKSILIHCCDLLANRSRCLDHARDQPHSERFFSGDDPTGECEIKRVVLADSGREAVCAAPRSEQPKRDARFGERRSRRSDSDVTGECEFQSPATGRAIDSSDDNRVTRFNGARNPLAVAGERSRRFGGTIHRSGREIGNDVKIGSGTERAASTMEKYNGTISFVHSGFERIERGGRECVAPFRSVDRYRANSVVICRPYHGRGSLGVSKGLCPLRANLRTMDEAAAVRRAARATVDDVEPAQLRDDLLTFINDISLTPGVLTLFTARVCSGSSDGFEQRAAGVQLIYNGLRLTRQLAREEPWESGERASADMHILAADVLVARGFYLLARTKAAATAVDVVRSFGRDQTAQHEQSNASLDAQLERDVLELALITGSSVSDSSANPNSNSGGDSTRSNLRDIADDLAAACEDTTGFPAPETFLSETVAKRLTRSVAEARADS